MSKLLEQINTAPRTIKKLGEVVGYIADNRGKNPSYYVDSGVPVIDNFMITGKRSIDLSLTKRFLDEKTYKEFIRKEIKKDDVLVTLVGNGFGQIALAPEERSVIIQNTIGLRSNDLSLNSYLFYLLSKYKEAITGLDRGAAQPSVKVGDLLDIEIDLPDFSIQKKIAEILSAYDAKIENNNLIIKKLEAIAQALFDEWFINFRFPGYEKTKFVDSEMGEIPEGWEISSLGEITNNHDSKRIPLSSMERAKRKGKIPYYGANGVLDYIDESIFSGEYILFAEDGTVKTNKGTPVIYLVDGDFWVNNHAHIISGKSVSNYYIYLSLRSISVDSYITGGVQPKITQQNLSSIPVIVPDNEIKERFEVFVFPIFRKIRMVKNENLFLKSQRDQLLAKLI